jgi:HlyD family secretion protein
MMQRRTAISIAVALLVLLGLIWAFAPDPVAVEIATVNRGSFVRTVDEDGVTRVRERYVITAPVSGTLLRPSVRAGDLVSRDQVVATIVPSPAQMLDARTRNELAARVEAASARLARAGAAVRQAEAAALQSQNERKRLDELAKQGFVSNTERERAELTAELRRKDQEAAFFEQDAAGHDLQQARAALRQSGAAGAVGERGAWIVRAPVAGQILRVLQESEGPIGIGGAIVEIGDVGRLEARIDVLTSEAIAIKPQAFVTLTAGDGLELTGRVRLVEPAARTKVSALGIEEQRVDVVVDLAPNSDASRRVGDGFRVDAKIEVEREDAALVVPVTALIRDAQRWAVYRLSDNRAELTTVELGARGGEVAVAKSGLQDGDSVIIYPSDQVADGVRVKARSAGGLNGAQ